MEKYSRIIYLNNLLNRFSTKILIYEKYYIQVSWCFYSIDLVDSS